MVTTARRASKPVSLFILMLFAVGPGFVSAGPPLDPAAAGAATARMSDVAATPIAAASRSVAAYSWTSSADITPGRGSRSVDDPTRWLDTNASASTPAKTGSWWSRRTTAQKTWFIVGIVAGAVGIYALASDNSGGGSGGGGY
jgi:hypothetical protein